MKSAGVKITAKVIIIILSVFAAQEGVSDVSVCKEDKQTNQTNIRNVAAAIKQTSNDEQTPKDERTIIDRKNLNSQLPLSLEEIKKLNSIGIVQRTDSRDHGTGFMINECLMLTAKHVVYDYDYDWKNEVERNKALEKANSFKLGQDVLFSVGQTGNPEKPFEFTRVPGKVVAFGLYNGTLETASGDWALIRVERIKVDNNREEYLGTLTGSLRTAFVEGDKIINNRAYTFGFPGIKPGDESKKAGFLNMWGDVAPECGTLGFINGGNIQHTCQITPGQSGGPLMVKRNERLFVIGLIADGTVSLEKSLDRKSNPNDLRYAVSFDVSPIKNRPTIGDEIKAAIEANPCN